MKAILTYSVYFAFGAFVASCVIANDSYEQSEQAQNARHANEFLAKAYGRE